MAIYKLTISEYKEIAKVLSGLSGLDILEYSLSSAKRRLETIVNEHNLTSVAEFTKRIITDSFFYETVLYRMSIPVSEMFRAPEFWSIIEKEFLSKIVKKTNPHICVPQCTSGEELYSLLILLKKNNLLGEIKVSAYDYSINNIKKIQAGVYPFKKLAQANKNFAIYAPTDELGNYCKISEDSFLMDTTLLEGVNLEVKSIFDDETGDYDFILFRNSLIYFGRNLHNKVLSHFNQRLQRGGFIAIGSKETIKGNLDLKFSKACKTENIYKKGRS